MRLLACSDLHCDLDATRRFVAQAADADVVIVAGDLATQGQGAGPILALLRTIPRPVVIVPGNHDPVMELRQHCHHWPNGYLLHDQSLTLQGIPLFGLGAEVPRENNSPWNFAMSEPQASAALAKCPAGAILITHSPPKGHCDRQPNGTQDGSQSILEAVKSKQPRLHLCGHIHAAFGQQSAIGGCSIHNLGPNPHWFTV